ncbi:hypothetical protein [Vibrio sp. SCSIO 43136]|uniref:hypothetical protein n=1 Tax=Vibrio sp. SCSIO 43136 TaxID=2819101 RepID=UPI0020764813|nr:hypothetical protein [Vibrio sp. SCSIO 43136]USD68022.1 hypothetical protein J4N39_17755 [Vibrio sp. SCSIO 43136]
MKKIFALYLHSMMRLAERYQFVRTALRKGNTLLVRYLVWRYEKKGLAAWQSFWIPAFAQYGNYRADYIAKKMNIQPTIARSVGAYHDYEDPILGVEGHWETNSEGEAIRVETSCVVCDDLMKATQNKHCRSDFCRHIVHAMESSTGKAINAKYKVGIISLLTEGDTSCQFVHRIDPS